MTVEVHEPFVPTDQDQRFANMILAQAKQHAEAGDCAPVAFMIGADESLTIMPLVTLGDWEDVRVRDAAAHAMRETARLIKPICFAFVSDAWLREFRDRKAIEAAGLDHRRWRTWRLEDLDRFMVKREVIMVSVETKVRSFMLTQFYRRDWKDRPIWEETTLREGGDAEGRFVGMLRGDQ